MAEYKLSNEAREDLIRIHQYGVEKFGMAQADKYYWTTRFIEDPGITIVSIQLPTQCKSITAYAVEQITKADRSRVLRPLQQRQIPRHATAA